MALRTSRTLLAALFLATASGFSPSARQVSAGISSSSSCRSITVLQAATSLPLESFSAPLPEESASAADTPKVGVLLLNLGGPEKADDVEGA